MKKPHSLRTQIMFFTAALLLTVAVLQLLFGAFFAKAYFVGQKKEQIEALFETIRAGYSDSLWDIYDLVHESEEVANIQVAIFSEYGLVYTSRSMGEERVVLDLSGAVFSETPETMELPETSGSQAQLRLSGRFSYQGGTRYVVLWVPVESIESSVAILNRASLYLTAFVLVVGLLGGALFARRIVRPLESVRRVSQRAAELDFTARADESVGIRELASLAGSVNRMSEQLSQSIQALQSANERLQEDVDRQKQLERMRREFIANVSHEMKTPLCLLQMYAENLKNNVAGVDKDYYCDTIAEESQRLSDMVGSMLDLSSIENGLSAMTLAPLELSGLCRELLTRMAPVLAPFRLTVGLERDLVVEGDGKFLEMAMKNYLSNAASHTPGGGRIRIELSRSGAEAVFGVENEGQPIPEGQLERLWDSFYKVDASRVRTEENHVGLGLAIVKAIVSRHQGRYWVENRPEGVAFFFALPLSQGREEG